MPTNGRAKIAFNQSQIILFLSFIHTRRRTKVFATSVTLGGGKIGFFRNLRSFFQLPTLEMEQNYQLDIFAFCLVCPYNFVHRLTHTYFTQYSRNKTILPMKQTQNFNQICTFLLRFYAMNLKPLYHKLINFYLHKISFCVSMKGHVCIKNTVMNWKS